MSGTCDLGFTYLKNENADSERRVRGAKIFIKVKVQLSYEKGYLKLGCLLAMVKGSYFYTFSCMVAEGAGAF